MPSGVTYFLELLGFTLFVLFLYNLIRKYFLSKIKVNKWVVLSIAILGFLLASFFPMPGAWSLIPSGIFVILLLWFFDLQGWGSAKNREKAAKRNDVVIRPKAKPNRVKNNK